MNAPRSRPKNATLKVAGLFAGIGGLELGLHAAGHKSQMLCEIEPGASAVLRNRFPKLQHVFDVRDVTKLPRGTSLLTAGFPCQDLSSSGHKSGISGSQSSLVDEVFRILERNDVDWVLFENVKFMLHLQGGRAMKRIATKFEQLGYRWAYRVLNTETFGLPQRRHRVYFLASRAGDPRDVLLSNDEPFSQRWPSVNEPIGFYWTEGAFSTGLAANAVPPLKGGSTIGIPSPPAILDIGGMVGTPSIGDSERLQGFPADWTLPAIEVARASHRWKLVGNAVSVPVAEWVGRKLANPLSYDSSSDRPMGKKWPHAGWSVDGKRFESAVSDSPLGLQHCGLDKFVRDPLKPLSRRAIDGFLGRVAAGRLKYPDGFLSSLQRFRDSVA